MSTGDDSAELHVHQRELWDVPDEDIMAYIARITKQRRETGEANGSTRSAPITEAHEKSVNANRSGCAEMNAVSQRPQT
jgi:hypothetical protein